jgi:hypothetical protein
MDFLVMRPSELSKALRLMALAIENSTRPSKARVAHDLQRLLSRISSDLESHKANYDGHECYSFRDEKWQDVESLIKRAIDSEYNCPLIDDGVMLFKSNDCPSYVKGKHVGLDKDEILEMVRTEWFE